MSTYTERDLVFAKRAAYRHGAETWAGNTRQSYGDFVDAVSSSAARQYPLPPKSTRPRVVQDLAAAEPNGRAFEFRVVKGQIERRSAYSNEEWVRLLDESYGPAVVELTTRRVKLLADLLANPNETVDV